MSRKIYRISGADREHFLQGLITNDIAKLENGLLYAALLSPQGKYIADFFLVADGDNILLDADAAQGPALARRLSMYKLRADVAIEETALHAHIGTGEIPADGKADPRHTALGWRAYRDNAQDNAPDLTALRIEHGIPATADMDENRYILEMGFERLHGVDFKKGCYVGQEVTARMKHKTELRKGLARVTSSAPLTAGSEITAAGKPVGTVLSAAGTTALAYLRFDRAEGAEAEGRSLTITPL